MFETKEKISIVIPIRNSEKTLANCLESVLNQNYKNYEIILIDNNSKDKTKEIIAEYSQKDNRISHFFEPKIGRSPARNLGILKSTGDIIAMTDSDCIASKTWLEKLIQPITKDNESIVMGNEQGIINNYWSRNIQDSNSTFNKKNLYNKYINTLDTKNFAIKSKVIKEFMFDDNLNNFEDFDLYLRLSKKYKIRFLSENKIGHYHRNSFITNITLNINRGYWTMKIYKKYKKNDNSINHPMFESISIINFIQLPFWLIWQLTKGPKRFPYVVTSEISWRIGLLGGLIK
jgi:glycosyltransferase involved in cell wall biosynthesis